MQGGTKVGSVSTVKTSWLVSVCVDGVGLCCVCPKSDSVLTRLLASPDMGAASERDNGVEVVVDVVRLETEFAASLVPSSSRSCGLHESKGGDGSMSSR